MENLKKNEANQIITAKPHQECMAALNEWKECDAVFKDVELSEYSKGKFATFDTASDYFEVSDETLKVIHRESLEHFKQDGVTVVTGEKLKKVGKKFLSTSYAPSLTLLTPRAVLRMGAKITKNKIGDQIISILLNNAQENKRKMKNNKVSNKSKKITLSLDEEFQKLFEYGANKNNLSKTEYFRQLIKKDNEEYFTDYEEMNEIEESDLTGEV